MLTILLRPEVFSNSSDWRQRTGKVLHFVAERL